MSAPILARLFVYPVKSCGGIPVDRWEVDELGLRHDRRWMVVDERGRFMTQRDHPRMSRIGVQLGSESLRLSAPGMPDLRVPLEPGPGPDREVTVWRSRVRARRLEGEASDWLTGFLGRPCGLVYMPLAVHRRLGGSSAPRRVSFADSYPFLLLSQESMDELNRRLGARFRIDRFRPNLVVRSGEAHAEDGWRRIRIGAIEFRIAKPCARCVITTVDPETGVRGPEPLRTLATYRKRDGAVHFGQNAVHRNAGVLGAGDRVEVLEAAR